MIIADVWLIISNVRLIFSHWRQIYTQTLHVWGNVFSHWRQIYTQNMHVWGNVFSLLRQEYPPILTSGDNRIYHHVAGGTRESHPSVQDLQSTTRISESWMLQILDTRMGFPRPSRNVVIDYFSPTCKMHKINNEKAINSIDFYGGIFLPPACKLFFYRLCQHARYLCQHAR